jgi:glycosyltransferase involved in cell wall biosynthesis
MPFYIGASDAVILTSDAEGSPMIVKEALMVGVPVVSVRVGDVPDIAELTDGCFVCDRDPADLASKLVTACYLRRRPINVANLSELSLETVAARLVAIYSRVLMGKEAVA